MECIFEGEMILVKPKFNNEGTPTKCRFPMFCISNNSLDYCQVRGVRERLHIVKFGRINRTFVDDPYKHWFKKDHVTYK